MKTGAQLIAEERQRQIDEEGWSPEHDDQHEKAEMAKAAVCYAAKSYSDFPLSGPLTWPWDVRWWKPSTRIRNLTKAGALIAAEIDRIQRLEE